MKIYNTNQFEKLNINPIKIIDLPDVKDDFAIIKNAVTDIDGNSYDGIQINGNVWMTSNLMTKNFNDGKFIGKFIDSNYGDYPYFIYPDVGSSEYRKYGFLYNYHAVKSGKLAPKGWHVPTFVEWMNLFKYIKQFEEFCSTNDKNGYDISKAMCSTNGWRHSVTVNAVGQNMALNNKTGFNIYPSGYCTYESGENLDVGINAVLWTSSERNDLTSYYIKAGYYHGNIMWSYLGFKYGMSVRCVKD